MPRIDLNGVHYHVNCVGQGEPLVLLHGFTGSWQTWSEHIDTFARHFRVFAVDLLGHGQSAAPGDPDRYRMENAAADLIAVLAELGAPAFHLLGYSMGGRLALYAAVHYSQRVKSLILESASPGLASDDERSARAASDEALAGRIEREGIPAFVDYWESLPLFATQKRLPQAARAELRARRLSCSAQGLSGSLRGMGAGVQPSLWQRLGELAMPVLLIAGQHDTRFVSIAGQMRARIPNAQVVTISDSGHTTHLEQPDEFRQRVLDFMGLE